MDSVDVARLHFVLGGGNILQEERARALYLSLAPLLSCTAVYSKNKTCSIFCGNALHFLRTLRCARENIRCKLCGNTIWTISYI